MTNPTVFYVRGTLHVTALKPLERGKKTVALEKIVIALLIFMGFRETWDFWLRRIHLRPFPGNASTWVATISFYAINVERDSTEESLRQQLARQLPLPTKVTADFVVDPIRVTSVKAINQPYHVLVRWFDTILRPMIDDGKLSLDPEFEKEMREAFRRIEAEGTPF